MIGIDVEQVANSHFRLRSVEQRHAEREGPLSGQAPGVEGSIALRDELRRALLLGSGWVLGSTTIAWRP